MEIQLSGQRALVMGASQGIGRASAIALAQAGAQVIVLARSKDLLSSLLKELPGSGHQMLVADVLDRDSLTKQISGVLQQGPLNICVNNSGGPKGGPLEAASHGEFEQAFAQHVLVGQAVAQLLIPGMKQARYGRIINIISTSVKAPIPNLGVSNTIRAAMASWAKSLSQEVALHGITVNNVLPGYTKTVRLESLRKATAERLKITEVEVENQWKASIPAGRFAEPSEVANAVLYLASPLASYVNGINLPVDGGRTPSL